MRYFTTLGLLFMTFCFCSSLFAASDKEHLDSDFEIFEREQKYKLSTDIFENDDTQAKRSILKAQNLPRKNYQRLFTAMDEVIPRFYGPLGSFHFKETYYPNISMSFMYQILKSELGRLEFSFLNWAQNPSDSLREVGRIRDSIIDAQTGLVKNEFNGLRGYIAYSNNFYDGYLSKAYDALTYALSRDEIQQLNWGKKQNTTSYKLEKQINERQKEAKNNKESVLISSILTSSRPEIKITPLAVKNRILNKIQQINSPDNIKSQYLGSSGFELYANEFHSGSLTKAFIEVQQNLSPLIWRSLGWHEMAIEKTFISEERIKITKLDRINLLVNEVGVPRKEYQGTDGYIKYSLDFFDGDMKLAYDEVKILLNDQWFSQLEWGSQFKGSTAQHNKVRNILTSNTDRIDLQKWYGIPEESLAKAVREVVDSNMLGHLGGSAVINQAKRLILQSLTPNEMELLGWDLKMDIDFDVVFEKSSWSSFKEKRYSLDNRAIIDPKSSVSRGKKR